MWLMSDPLKVFANWDSDAQVWVAESNDVPGLITEAPTVEALIAKLHVLIPELLEENSGADNLPEVPVSVIWQTTQTVRLHKS
jgi:predicted RNase H-like HicB family nuclease